MLLTQSALSLAADIKAKKISSRAVVEAHIAQVKCVNPRLNAVVFDRFAEALREADAADALIASTTDPESLPPLLGVPCIRHHNTINKPRAAPNPAPINLSAGPKAKAFNKLCKTKAIA